MTCRVLLLGLLGCGAPNAVDKGPDGRPGQDADTDTDTDTDGDTDSDTDTDTEPEVSCTPWSLAERQRFDEATLFGGQTHADGAENNGPGVALLDLDLDGDLDVFFAINSPFSVGLRNDGAGSFTVDPGFALADGGALPVGNAVAFADLDDNGAPDVVLGGPAGSPDVVLYNDGTGRFTQVDLPESTGETMGVTLADVDGDGRLDILTAGFDMDADQGAITPGEHLGDGSWVYLQGPEGTWTDGRAVLPADTLYDLSYHFALIDADTDGLPDLFLSNDHGVGTGFPNYLLHNTGEGTYVQDAESGCQQRTSGMGAAVGDPDGNGAPDLYLSNWGSNNLYLNLGDGRFYDSAAASGVQTGPNGTDGISYASRFVDLDGDLWEDLAVMYGVTAPAVIGLVPEEQPDRLWHNDGEGHFTDISDEVAFDSAGWGRGLAAGDVNGDAVPDLVASERIGLIVYLGEGGCPGPKVTLRGPAGNREGIGARLEVTTSRNRSFTRWMLPSSTLSQSATELTLGLAGAARARVTVYWPDGAVSEHTIQATSNIALGRE